MRSITTRNHNVDSDVLLLGATGRLGQVLMRHWPQHGQLVGQSRQPQAGMIAMDPLAAPKQLLQAAKGVNAVICLAGITPSYAAECGSEMSLNTDLALAAIAAAPTGARIFLASSAAVYGAADGPHSEADPVAPVSAYGQAKYQMEQVALAQEGKDVCVLRIGNVAGADAILGGWRPGMLLDRLDDGTTPRRSYIGPITLARVIHALCAAPALPPVLNIATPGVIAMGDLLDAAGLSWRPREPDGPVIEEVALDTKLLKKFYQFEPETFTAKGMVAEWRKGAVKK